MARSLQYRRTMPCVPPSKPFRSIASGGGFSSPVSDSSPFMGPGFGETDRIEAARASDDACSSVGFFYSEGHGIVSEEIEHLHRSAKQFFSSPTAVKEEIAMSGASTGRGYQRSGENVTLQMRDWQEAIDFFAEIPTEAIDSQHFGRTPVNMGSQQIDQSRRFVQARNLWPSEPPEFRAAAEAYFAKVSEVGNALMRAMAVGLGLPEHFFDSVTDRSFWCVRVIGYPASHREQSNLSCGEHTDYGCWTISAQDETPDALEVQSPGVWTQGRYVATRHRVRQTAGDYRTSIAFFYEPNFDAVIRPSDSSPLSGWQAIEHRPVASTEPLQRGLAGQESIYGEHLFAKVTSNFDFE